MAVCTCSACQSQNTVAVYFHRDCNSNWFKVVRQPQRDPQTGKPVPVPCPDDLVDCTDYSRVFGMLDGFAPCGQQLEARVLYCYSCKQVTVYPPTPAG